MGILDELFVFNNDGVKAVEKPDYEQTGFTIAVKVGDVVDAGGPMTTVAIDGSMWVPEGSYVNGKLVENDGPQD